MSALSTRERGALLLIALFAALAGVANYGKWAAIPRFAIATVALAGLAWIVSFATEQLGERFGPGVTGVLQSTLGNLPELFVVIFALQKGELVVAQTALVGSVLANALLVLGLVIVVGARRSKREAMRTVLGNSRTMAERAVVEGPGMDSVMLNRAWSSRWQKY